MQILSILLQEQILVINSIFSYRGCGLLGCCLCGCTMSAIVVALSIHQLIGNIFETGFWTDTEALVALAESTLGTKRYMLIELEF